MEHQELEHFEVEVTAAQQLYNILEEAEAALLPAAIARGSAGILITRHDLRRYTVALSDTVPFGETRELSLSGPVNYSTRE